MAGIPRDEKALKKKAMISEYETYGVHAAGAEPIRIPAVRICSADHCGKPCISNSLQCREHREDAIRHELRDDFQRLQPRELAT